MSTRLTLSTASLVLGLGLILLGPVGVSSASAQGSATPSAEETSGVTTWRANVDDQIASMLRGEPSARASFIRVAIELAEDERRLDFVETSGALLEIVDRDPVRRHRLMAVQALDKIAPEHLDQAHYRQVMGQLHTLMEGESSKQVRDVAAATLNRYATRG